MPEHNEEELELLKRLEKDSTVAADATSVSNMPALSIIGTRGSTRRALVPNQEGGLDSHPIDIDGLLDFTRTEEELVDPDIESIARLLAAARILKLPGGFEKVPKPFIPKLGRAIELARVQATGTGIAGGAASAEVLFNGFASTLRAVLRRVGVEGPVEVNQFLGPGGQEPIESLETAEQTSSPNLIDVTSPAAIITPERWVEIQREDPFAARLYRTRRLLDATFRGSLLGPLLEQSITDGPIAFTSAGAQARGLVAPARDGLDTAIDIIGNDVLGPLIPGILAFPAFAAGGAAFGATRLGAAAAGAIGTPGKIRAIGASTGAGAGAVLGNQVAEFRGGEDRIASILGGALFGAVGAGGAATLATRLGGQSVNAFTQAFIVRAPQVFATFGAEAALGSAFGGIFGARHAIEVGREEAVLKETIKGVLFGGAMGFAIALPIRSRGLSQITRAGRIAENLHREGALGLIPGDIVNATNGLTYKGARKNGSSIWMVNKESGKGLRFAKKTEIPDENAVFDFVISKAVRTGRTELQIPKNSLLDDVAEIEKIKARQHTQEGMTPMDTPEKLAVTEELAHLTNFAEIDYMSTARAAFTRHIQQNNNPLRYEALIERHKLVAGSVDDIHTRATAIGRARALERVRSQGGGDEFPSVGDAPATEVGTQPFEVEKFVREDVLSMDAQQREAFLAREELKAATSINQFQKNRSRMLLESFDRQTRGPALESRQAEVKAALKAIDFPGTRGVKKGSTVMFEGNVHDVVDSASWGMARIKRGNEDSFLVSLKDVDVVPGVNRYGMVDGINVPVRFVRTSAGRRKTLVKIPGIKAAKWIDNKFVRMAGDSFESNQHHRRLFKAEQRLHTSNAKLKGTPVKVQKRTVVSKETGQKITVESETATEVIGKTKTGKTKVLSKEEVGRSSKDTGGDREAFELKTFEPGTKPSARKKSIGFVRVSQEDARNLENVIELFGDHSQVLAQPSTTIFPSPHVEGTVLFAVERTAPAKLRSTGAKKALGILSGKKPIESLNQDALDGWVKLVRTKGAADDIRVSRVPEGLETHILGLSGIKNIGGGEQLSYLKRLTDLSFESNTAATKAKGAGERAVRARKRAKAHNRGDAVAQADRALEEARGDIVKAHFEQTEEITQAMGDAQLERVRELANIEDSQASQVLRAGEPSAVRTFVKDYPSVGETYDYSPMVFPSETIPGAKTVLTKIKRQQIPGKVRHAFRRKDANVIPGREFLDSPEYLIEVVAEDGSIAHSEIIRNDNQVQRTPIPAIKAAGTPVRQGETLIAVVREAGGPSEVRQVQVKEVRSTRRGRAGFEERYPNVPIRDLISRRKKLPNGKTVFENMKKVVRPDGSDEGFTHMTEAEVIQLVREQVGSKVDSKVIQRALQGKGLLAREPGNRSNLSAEGRAEFDAVGTLKKDGIIDAAEAEKALEEIAKTFPAGQTEIQVVDALTQEPFTGSSSKQALESSNPFIELIDLEGVDVLPDNVFDRSGRITRLHRIPDEFRDAGIDRFNIARSPKELQSIGQLAEEFGAGVVEDVPYKVLLNDEQVLDRVVDALDNVNFKANLALNGNEYRSAIPGVYATIYRSRTERPWLVQFWRTPTNRRDPLAQPVAIAAGGPELSLTPDQLKLSMAENTGEFHSQQRFITRESAEAFVAGEGFFRPSIETVNKARPLTLYNTMQDKINVFHDMIPDNVRVDDAIGGYNISDGKSTGGIPARDLVSDKGFTARQIATRQGQVTKARNALAKDLKQSGMSDKSIRDIILAGDDAGRRLLPQEDAFQTIVGELDQLPAIESIRVEQLDELENALKSAYNWFSTRNRGYVVPSVKDYMMRFANRAAELAPDRAPPFDARIRDRVGIVADRDIVRLGLHDRGFDTQALVLGAETEAQQLARASSALGDAFDIMPGRMIRQGADTPITSDYIETLQAVKRFHDSIVDRAPMFRSVDGVLDPSDVSASVGAKNIARVTVEGQESLATIINHNFERGTVHVQTPDGASHHIPLADIEVVRSADASLDFVRQQKIYAGEPFYLEGIHDIGFSDIDRSLGIRPGASRENLITKIRERRVQLLGTKNPLKAGILDGIPFEATPSIADAPIQFTEKGFRFSKNLSKAQIDELVDLHVRAIEAGEANMILAHMPKPIRRPFKRLVFDRIVQQKGDDPITHIEALLKSDLMTTKQKTKLAEHAKANGINDPNPIVQMDGLLKANALDPEIGALMQAVNKQAGMVRFFSTHPGIEPNTVDISSVANVADLWKVDRIYAGPAAVGKRHPSAEMFTSHMFDAINQEARQFENVVLQRNSEILRHYGFIGFEGFKKQVLATVKKGARGSKVKSVRQIKEARDLLNEFPTWKAVLESKPDVDPGVEFAFTRMRDMTNELRLYVIQSAQRQGRRWVRFGDLDDATQTRLRKSFDSETGDISDDLMVVDRANHAAARRTKTEVEEFTELLEQFKDSESIPKQVKEGVPPWMIEEFDLWKNFGIESYWPYVHRGRVLIQAFDDAGVPSTVAWARSGIEAIDITQRLVKEGRVQPTTQMRIKTVGVTMDDVLMELIDKDRYEGVIKSLMRASDIDRVTAAEVVSGAGLRPVSGRTELQNLQIREANLQSLFDNPLEELMIYGARVMRNRYLLDIDDAFSWMRTNDRNLSNAMGVTPLDELPKMTGYMKDLWSTAKGESTSSDAFMDGILDLGDALGRMPKDLVNAIKKHGLTGETLEQFKQVRANERLVERPLRGRQVSGSFASLQGFLKLGTTPMAPIVNLTQLAINTYPVLGQKYFFEGTSGFHDLFMGKLGAAEKAELVGLLDQIGVKWQRSVAGARAGLPLPAATAPGQTAVFGRMLAMQRPMIHGTGQLGNLVETVNHMAMMAFEGAETYNRSVSAIGAYRRGLASVSEGGLGLSSRASVEYARQVVRETQFLYFDAALPKMLRGPAAKVLAQFKPYLFNQLVFEKNLVIGMAKGDAQSAKVFARHTAAIFAFGGTRALAKHPIIGGLVALMGLNHGRVGGLFGEPKAMAEAAVDAENNVREEPLIFAANRALTHGLPGLTGLTVAQRVGISATDLQFWNNGFGFFFGPTGSAVADWLTFFGKQAAQGEEGARATGISLLSMAALKSAASASSAGPLPPFSLMLAALAVNEIQTHMASDGGLRGRQLFPEFPDTLDPATTPEANRLRGSLNLKVFNDFKRTIEIYQESLYYDASGRAIHMPLSGFNRVSSMFWTGIGGQSVDAANQLALQQMLLAADNPHKAKRQTIINAIARAIMADDPAEVLRLRKDAEEQGLTITDASVNANLRRRQQARTKTVEQLISPESLE